MMWRNTLVIALLLTATLVSALMLIESKYENRKLFAELRKLQQQRDTMNIEWGKLQLEESTFTTHAVVERVASSRLQMEMPKQNNVRYLR